MQNVQFFKTFLLKVAGRCNIDCDYCYEYNLPDQSWRGKPSKMSIAVLNQTIDRIEEHIRQHSLKYISIIFHGGEPLLAGKDFFRYAVNEINSRFNDLCKVKFGMQSNGILLDKSWAELLKELKIGTGISVDGYKELNDKHRLDKRGRSTFPKLEAALKLMSKPEYAEIKGGFLCVMQVDTDPIELFQWFSSYGKTQIDFLFPHYNHDRKPLSTYDSLHGYGYGLWLTKVFDYWWLNDLSDVKVRLFEDLMHLMLGGRFTVESLGLAPVQLVVIQTDGEYEAVDSLKSTYDGAVATHKTVFNSPLNNVFEDYLIFSRVARLEHLSEQCRKCRLVKVCGGGYLPHRFHADFGFKAPSIYCQDLTYLIEHIEKRLEVTVDAKLKEHMASSFSHEIVDPI